jgi:hypothetical protein
MATTSMSSTASYEDRMSNTAKSRFMRGRSTFAGRGRRKARSARADKLSATSAVRGGAADAAPRWPDGSIVPPTVSATLDIDDSHLLRDGLRWITDGTTSSVL